MKDFDKTAGFSLLELLIAGSMMALIAVVLSVTLHKVLLSCNNLQQLIRHLLLQQRAFELIATDLMSSYNTLQFSLQAKHPSAAITGSAQHLLLTYIDHKQLGSQLALVRSSYWLHKAQLIRSTWALSKPQAASSLIIATKLRQVTWQYIDQKQRVHHVWPPQPQAAKVLYLVAVKMTLAYLNASTSSQIYWLPPSLLIAAHA